MSRRILWAIVLLYALPGLLGRAPWNPDDAIGFAQAYHFLNIPINQWAYSQIGDQLFAQEGLLMAWVAALLGKIGLLFGAPNHWIDDIMRLGNLLWLLIAGWAIWHTTYRLAKRAELQPEDPLGKAPTRFAYARAVADSSLLCLLGTLGLLLRSHFQVAELAELAGLSVILLAAVRSLDRPMNAGWLLGLGIAMAFFARGWAHFLPMLIALLVGSSTHQSMRFGLYKRAIRAAFITAVFFLMWFFWLMSHSKGEAWWSQWVQWNLTRFIALDPSRAYSLDLILTTFKTAAWFLWPILPMAAWTIWRYRNAIKEPAIRIPIFASIGGLFALLLTNPAEEANYFPMLAPLCVLAAIGLSTMRRSLIGLIDWFAIGWFSLGAILVWVGWSATRFGLPEKIAANFEKLSPGYVADGLGIELLAALIATAAWFDLIKWRTGRSSTKEKAIWRPMVLTSGGITLIWLLLMTLWLPRIDYAKNFGPVAMEIRHAIESEPLELDCIVNYELNLSESALLHYHANLPFRTSTPSNSRCNFLLIEDSLKSNMAKKADLETRHASQWKAIWVGNRNSDRHERFVLFTRVGSTQ